MQNVTHNIVYTHSPILSWRKNHGTSHSLAFFGSLESESWSWTFIFVSLYLNLY